jgi:hypothetical protein
VHDEVGTIAINVGIDEFTKAKKAQEGHAGCEFGVRIARVRTVHHGPYRDQPAINCFSYEEN